MRELQLFREYLVKVQTRHLFAAVQVASGSLNTSDYWHIVQEAKAAEVISRLIKDLDELERDSGEFIKQFLT